ncbi:unnamed protein product [Allacma fusca]|uniref:Uncharacterized protein n=1 Tax=Allacma fusca TaxID=39272 RepID=A0A8J2KZX0_9HEXA|nr:unnamed protein product [Allacma fusca]
MVLPRDSNNNCLASTSTWDSFVIAHIIDPSEPQNSNYGMWNGAQWRQWLSDREPLHPAFPRLTQKGINSVVVGSPAEILDAFNDQSHLLNDRFVWTSRRFRMYVFLMSHGGFQRVLDCLELYFAVRLENGRPVHLHASNSHQIRSGNANYNFNDLCREI